MRHVLPILLALGVTSGVAVSPLQAQRQPPGATQGGPTTGDEMMPPFDLRYFLGDWEIEWSPPETPLLPGGKHTGVERVRHIANGRYLEVTVEIDGPDRSLRGRGIVFLETGPFGAHLTKYVVYDAGFALLQPGAVGGDLGGTTATSGRPRPRSGAAAPSCRSGAGAIWSRRTRTG